MRPGSFYLLFCSDSSADLNNTYIASIITIILFDFKSNHKITISISITKKKCKQNKSKQIAKFHNVSLGN